MKKILFLAMISVSITLFAQNRFSKINSISELKNEYQKISEAEKNIYYDRYFKLATVEDLKKQTNFSKFSHKILLDLVDGMYDESKSSDSDFDASNARSDWKSTYDKVEQYQADGKDLELEDLDILYYRLGEYSTSRYYDLEAHNNLITYVMHVGSSGGHYNVTCKVKKNKVVQIKSVKTF